MHKPRYRREGRGLFSTGCGRYGKFNLSVIAGILLLMGSVCLLQVRLTEDGKRSSVLARNNRTAYSLDAMEREKMRLLREGEERDQDLEREYKIMLAEEGEGLVTGGGDANFDDELETEIRSNESEKEKEKEKEDDEEGGERFEELDAEMDMEDEDVDEFESFQGDVGEWLNEVDEFSGKKSETDEGTQGEKSWKYNTENSAEGFSFEGDRKGHRKERGEERRGLEGSKSDVGSESHKEILITRTNRNKGEERQVKEIVDPISVDDGDKQVANHTNENSNSVGKQATVSADKPEPTWIQSLGYHKKMTKEEESMSSSVSTAEQASKTNTGYNTYLRGTRSGGTEVENIVGARRVELADGDVKISAYFRDSDLGRGVFSTDDEPVDDDTLKRVEKMVDFEDVLMINKNPSSESRSKKVSDKEAGKKDKGRTTYDPLNPANNPLLQDPDTNEGNGLTKSDRVLLKARKQSVLAADSFFEGESVQQSNDMEKKLETHPQGRMLGETETGTHVGTVETRYGKAFELLNEEEGSNEKVDESYETTKSVSSVTDRKKDQRETSNGDVKLMASDRRRTNGDDESPHKEDLKKGGRQVHKLRTNGDTRRWGHFPGLHPYLSFTGFLEEFLFDEKCGLKVFMAWTTPPWSFTIRHQRVLESLLYFHPDACVVVFSDSIELTFFQSFVDEGYRVAVALPQLQELLEGTPSEDFAAIYLQWREVGLFYRHYTELLRLAALYKYGGIYLDMDMIVLKPLTGLHNTLGSETLLDGHTRPNGAAMFFERFSPFLNACMVEYTATYDEKLEEWNGAALLERVVNGQQSGRDGSSLEVRNSYNIERPSAFFPLSSSDIFRYFVAPEDETARAEEDLLFSKILEESYTVHLWNALTSKLVPEPGSLVHRFMERKCMRCMDVL